MSLDEDMFFYIDESGNTGNNLFDKTQPFLYYGILSSRVNLDALAEPILLKIRKQLNVPRLHANELGIDKLDEIGNQLTNLKKKFDLHFDMCRLNKPDLALIYLFDQVFDPGNNPAVPRISYWSALRYFLLINLHCLFDQDLLETAWEARINRNNEQAQETVVSICRKLLNRIHRISDVPLKQVFYDVLSWAADNPGELCYNAIDKDAIKAVSPNIICFQNVLAFISKRVNKLKPTKVSIIVDRQSQFNQAQQTLAGYYAEAKGINLEIGPGLPCVDLRGMPKDNLIFTSSQNSAGLELVDIYLWVFKRWVEERKIPPNLYPLINEKLIRKNMREISMKNIKSVWNDFQSKIPELIAGLTPEMKAKASELWKVEETRRLQAMSEQTR